MESLWVVVVGWWLTPTTYIQLAGAGSKINVYIVTTIFFTMSTILWTYCSRTKNKSWCKVKTYGNPVIHILLMQIFVLCVTVSDSFSGLISELLLSRVTLLLVRWVLLTHYTTWEQGILIMGSGKKFEEKSSNFCLFELFSARTFFLTPGV